jgi:PAS domain S-box-containing protein
MESKFEKETRTGRVRSQGERLTIGYLVPAVRASPPQWLGILDAAQKRGVNLICFEGGSLVDHSGFQSQASVLYDLVSAESIDGVISWASLIGTRAEADDIRAFHDRYRPLPMVTLGVTLGEIPSLFTDSYSGMYEAVVHLIEVHGHRRLAFIQGPEDSFYAQERYRAYTDALESHGLSLDPNLVTSPSQSWDPSDGRQAMCLLLDERGLRPQVDLEAVVAANDHLLLGALEVLRERGIRVPGDVAAIGFDDIAQGRVSTPPFTSVASPFYKVGGQAVETLLALIGGAQVQQKEVMPTRLVIRQSCGCQPLAVTQIPVDPLEMTGEKPESTLTAWRQDILAAMLQTMGESLDVTMVLAGQLLDGFSAEINGAQGAFLLALDEALRQVMAAGGDVTAWQGAISALRRHWIPHLDGKALLQAEDLWQQARVAIGETAQRVQAYRQLQAEQQARLLHEIGAALITAFDVEELMNIVAERLPNLGIPSCYISLYEDPKAPAGWSRLVLAYNEKGRIELEPGGQRFPSRQLTPESLMPQGRRYTMMAEPLYFHHGHIGLALFEVGPREGRIYETLRVQLSSALEGTLLLQKHRQTEEALRASEERFALAERGANYGLYDWKIQNDSLYWSPRLKELLGYAADELDVDFNTFVLHLHPDDRERVEAALEAHLKDRVPYDVEERLRTKSGEYRWFNARGQALWDEDGNPVRMTGHITDITARKRAEEALEKSEERFRKQFEEALDAIFVADAETGIVIDCNRAACELVGREKSELVGQHQQSLHPPEENGEEFSRTFKQHLKEKEGQVLETQVITKKGEIKEVAIKANLFELRGQQVIQGIFRDITKRKQAEEEFQRAQTELQRQNARLETLYHVGQMVNSTLDTHAILDKLTDEAMRVTRATHGQVLVVRQQEGCFERRSQRGFSPAEVERAQSAPLPLDQGINARAYLTHQAVRVDDVRAEPGYFPLIPTTRSELAVPIIRDGEVLGNLDLQSPEVDAFRDVDLGYLNALTDQVAVALSNAELYAETRRRLKEQTALREASAVISSALDLPTVLSHIAEQMAQAVDATSAYISSYTFDAGVILSTVLAEHIGSQACDRERVPDLGTTYVEDNLESVQTLQAGRPSVVHWDDPNLPEFEKGHMEQYGAQTILYVPLQVKGQLIGFAELWESRRRREFTSEEIALCQGIAQQAAIAIENARLFEQARQEIAERKRAEKTLQMYAAKLERSNRELEEFAYVASHDLQEPLRKVKAFGDRLKAKYADVFDERGLDYLERMQSAAVRMQDLINALLTYSRVTTKAQPFVPVDLAQTVQDVLSDLEVRIEQVGGKVIVDRLPTIDGDPTQMRQLLQNLISNALKFHRPDEPPVVKIHGQLLNGQGQRSTEGSSSGGQCQITVLDNGIGFDEQYQDRIFQVFQRLHNRTEYEGTGIGLAICRKIVERHGGSITAQSTPDQGATFIVTLPIHHHQEAKANDD